MSKWLTGGLAICLALSFAVAAQAKPGEGEKGAREKGKQGDRRAEILKRFDKDESGDLNDEEKAAARKAFAERRGGKGRPPFDREAMMKKFDKDESGDLNEEERAALKAHLAEMREKRGGEGRPGRGGPRFDREKVLAEFDADKDGKLNEEEKAAAKAAMKERFQKAREGKGPRGKGKPDGERRKPRPQN